MSRDTRPARETIVLNGLTGELEFPCKSFVIAADETINFIDLAGKTRTDYPAQKGYNPVGIRAINVQLTAVAYGLDKAR